MSVDPGRQGLEFLWAAGLGAALGLIYDLGRALRREHGAMTIPVDGAFALLFFLSLWLTSVYTHGLRVYQCLGVFLGAGAYFLTLSPPLVALWRRGIRALGRGGRRIRRNAKKSVDFLRKPAKKLFPSGRKWGTMEQMPHDHTGPARRRSR